MQENLLIVFAKNILLGKVKTRLAKDIGDNAAFEVYKKLVEITELETQRLNNCEVRIYFSDVIIPSKWKGSNKYVQSGEDLGKRMQNAFECGFKDGFKNIVGIGTDLPEISAEIIQKGFSSLQESSVVFGPAEDGGYYLIGMNNMISELFNNKSWSSETLLDESINELQKMGVSFTLMKKLNDIDTIDDLRKSSIRKFFDF